MKTMLPGNVNSIAVFRALQLGDMLCAIPAIRSIRAAWPAAHITLVGLPWQESLTARFPQYLDSFIEFPGWPGLPERKYRVDDVMIFLHAVQQRRFDLVLQMQGDGYIVNPMCMLWGARHVAGLRRVDDRCSDDSLFPVLDERDHEIHRFLKVAEAVGAPSKGTHLEFPILPREESLALEIRTGLGLEPGRYICLHPGARDPRRRWPACDFGRLGDALTARGFTVLLTGSGEERMLLREVESCLHTRCVNLIERCGHVGVGELAALIRDSGGLVSNDTGVSHIAAALRSRSVILFSAFSQPSRWAPLDRNLHLSIRAEEAGNVMYVIQTALHHLDLSCESVDAVSAVA